MPIRLILAAAFFTISLCGLTSYNLARGDDTSLLETLDQVVYVRSGSRKLGDVVDELSRQTRLEIQIDATDRQRLVAGGDPQSPVRVVLDQVLGRCGLSWTVSGSRVVVGSADQIWARAPTRFYGLHGLLPTNASRAAVAEQELLDTIKSTVTPNQWDDVGGRATVLVSRGTIMVTHTWHAQQRVRDLLARLRKRGARSTARPTATNQLTEAAFATPQDRNESRLLAQLVSVDFMGTPLSEALKVLDAGSPLSFALQQNQLDEVGIDGDTAVTLKLQRVSLAATLNHLLRELELAYTIDGHSLIITTPEAIEEHHLRARVYPVADIGSLASSESGDADLDWLLELITTLIQPESWDVVGGSGSVRATEGQLVVRHHREVQQQIAHLLGRIRDAIRLNATGAHFAYSLKSPAAARREAELRASLENRVTSMDVVEEPLSRVLVRLERAAGVPFLADTRALDWVGIELDTPVTIHATAFPVKAVLERILRDLELTYEFRDEVVLITLPEEAENHLVTQCYSIRDLATLDGRLPDKHAAQIADDIVDCITESIAPASWDDVGGPGAIDVAPGVWWMFVSQTNEIHQRIPATLMKIREARKLAERWENPVDVEVLDDLALPEREILTALQRPARLRFEETSLGRVATTISQSYGMPVALDERALETIGIGADTPVTFSIQGVSLGAALRHMLRDLELVFLVRHNTLLITTPAEAEYDLYTWTYPVADLVMLHVGEAERRGAINEGRDPQLDLLIKSDYDSLIEMIVTMVAPETWDEVGGPGTVTGVQCAGALLISQTLENHGHIADLLRAYRAAHRMQAETPHRLFKDPLHVGAGRERIVRQAMKRPASLVIADMPLGAAAAQLSNKTGVPFVLDHVALDARGIDATTSITVATNSRPLSAALRDSLDLIDLVWTIRDDAVMITSEDDAEEQLDQRIYLVHDLLAETDAGFLDFDGLISDLVDNVAPRSWDEVGGPGAIDGTDTLRALVIAQTEEVHEQIEARLAALRDSR